MSTTYYGLQYWKPSQFNWNRSERLWHTAGNFPRLAKLKLGARLYIVTYLRGKYYTLDHPFTPNGRGCVQQKEAEKIATSVRPRIADGVYRARYHVIATRLFPMVRPVEFTRVLQKVRFADGSLVGKLHGPNAVQKFRAMRQIPSGLCKDARPLSAGASKKVNVAARHYAIEHG